MLRYLTTHHGGILGDLEPYLDSLRVRSSEGRVGQSLGASRLIRWRRHPSSLEVDNNSIWKRPNHEEHISRMGSVSWWWAVGASGKVFPLFQPVEVGPIDQSVLGRFSGWCSE